MIFKYRARTQSGEVLEDVIDENSREDALNALRKRDLVVIAVEQADKNKNQNKMPVSQLKKAFAGMKRISTVPVKTAMVFMRQLAAMLDAGIDINAAFDIIIEQERNLRFREIISGMQRDIRDGGMNLSAAMSEYSMFDDLSVSIIKSGEESGRLSEALERASDLIEKQSAFKSRIKNALLYPLFVIICALFVLAIFIIYIMPGFKQVFDAMNIETPAVTQFILSVGDYFTAHAAQIIIIFALFIILFLWLAHSSTVRPFMDRMKLKIPVVKNLIFKSAMARSTYTLAVLTSSGVPLLSGLKIAGGTSGNTVINNAFIEMEKNVRNGAQLGEAAKNTGVFPVLISQMMRIGQETGNLDGMLERAAAWYEQELNGEIKTVSSLLEPVMIIIAGIVVGVMLVSLIGPVTSAISQI